VRLSREPADIRTLLAKRGFTVAAAERRAQLAAGTFSRLLAGRRGLGRVDTVIRIAGATGIRAGVFMEALAATINEARDRRRQMQLAELARLEAESR
jgi:transcriptional regulator with XRE-family HTH domain